MQLTPLYPLPLLQAASRCRPRFRTHRRGRDPRRPPSPMTPRRVTGPAIGTGSRISVHARETGRLVEDIRSAWVTCAT